MSDCMRPMPINNYIDNKSILSSRKNRTNQHTNKNNTKKQTGTNRNQKQQHDPKHWKPTNGTASKSNKKQINRNKTTEDPKKSNKKQTKNKLKNTQKINRNLQGNESVQASTSKKKTNSRSSSKNYNNSTLKKSTPKGSVVRVMGSRSKSVFIKPVIVSQSASILQRNDRNLRQQLRNSVKISKKVQRDKSNDSKKGKKQKKRSSRKSSKNIISSRFSSRNPRPENQLATTVTTARRTGQIKSKIYAESAQVSRPTSTKHSKKGNKSNSRGQIVRKLFNNEAIQKLQTLQKLPSKQLKQKQKKPKKKSSQRILKQIEKEIDGDKTTRGKIQQQLKILLANVVGDCEKSPQIDEFNIEVNIKGAEKQQRESLSNKLHQQRQKYYRYVEDNPSDSQFEQQIEIYEQGCEIPQKIPSCSEQNNPQMQEEKFDCDEAVSINITSGQFNQSNIFHSEKQQNQMLKPNIFERQVQENLSKQIPEESQMCQSQYPNPLISRRNNQPIDLSEYDSINSNLNEKQRQIAELKNFKQKSTKMMEKVTKQIVPIQTTPEPQPISITPKNIQVYSLQKYPQNQLFSPKFTQTNLDQIISYKQRINTSHHDKMNKLVNLMFEQNVLSPKTHQLQLTFLNSQYQKEIAEIENYRKNADALAKLLEQIKKEKQDISGIDLVISQGKWDQGLKIVTQLNSLPFHAKEPTNPQVKQQIQTNQEQKVINNLLIKVPHLQNSQKLADEQDFNKYISESNSSIIKIDEPKSSDEEQEKVKKNRGFESNLYHIKQYCIGLCQFVKQYYNREFEAAISKPLTYNLLALLKGFRMKTDQTEAYYQNSLFENLGYHQCVKAGPPPISEQMFEEFNKTYEGIKYYGKQETQNANLERTFLKSVYDALNQSLEIEKPGSFYGESLPWVYSSCHLKNLKNSKQKIQEIVFGIAIARIIQWGSCLCGFIPDTVELQNTQIDEQYVKHIKQTRMALFLQKLLSQQSPLMGHIQLQTTEVKLSIANLIVEQLMKQQSQVLASLQHPNGRP